MGREPIGIDRQSLRDPFNRAPLLSLINIERIHMIDRRHEGVSVHHDPL